MTMLSQGCGIHDKNYYSYNPDTVTYIHINVCTDWVSEYGIEIFGQNVLGDC